MVMTLNLNEYFVGTTYLEYDVEGEFFVDRKVVATFADNLGDFKFVEDVEVVATFTDCLSLVVNFVESFVANSSCEAGFKISKSALAAFVDAISAPQYGWNLEVHAGFVDEITMRWVNVALTASGAFYDTLEEVDAVPGWHKVLPHTMPWIKVT